MARVVQACPEGKKWLIRGFMFLLISEHKRNVTQPGPAQEPFPTTPSPGLGTRVPALTEGPRAGASRPRKQNLENGLETSLVMFLLTAGVQESLVQFRIGHLESVIECGLNKWEEE